jgi:hypothetical protein
VKELTVLGVLWAVDLNCNPLGRVKDVHPHPCLVHRKLFVDYVVLPVGAEKLLYLILKIGGRRFMPTDFIFTDILIN